MSLQETWSGQKLPEFYDEISDFTLRAMGL